MAQIPVTLKAGKTTPVAIPGAYFLLMETGSAGSVQIRFYDGTTELESLTTAKRGTKARPSSGRFTRIDMTSAIDTVCQIIISNGEIDIDVSEGANVNATILGLPLPVSNDRGSPGNPVHMIGSTLSDAPGVSIVDGAPVAVGPALVQVAAADANRRVLRLANIGANPVAIGGATLTWARRVIVLEPGDVFEETKGANLAWSAITDAGQSASVTAQGVLS